jgi:hypothetical protein
LPTVTQSIVTVAEAEVMSAALAARVRRFLYFIVV